MSDQQTTRRGMPKMEGTMARWYARQRRSGSQLDTYREQARLLTADLAVGADVLEVAPGPGYLAVEIARLGRCQVAGLDISHTFVGLARQYAADERVPVDFRQGDVAALPFADNSVDLIICQAAFKNFPEPVRALDEMHRVLRPGGSAIIQDMNHAAANADLDEEIARMRLTRVSAFVTRRVFTGLRMRALTADSFRRYAAASSFGGCQVRAEGITLAVRMAKHTP